MYTQKCVHECVTSTDSKLEKNIEIELVEETGLALQKPNSSWRDVTSHFQKAALFGVWITLLTV